MRKLMCILLSVIIIGITGCGQQSDEILEEANIQAPVTVESFELKEETSLITSSTSAEENAKDNISLEEYESFRVTTDAKDAEGYDKFDDFADVLNQNFIGTWYDPEVGEAIRLTDEWAYVYIPFLDEYGDTPYEWEIIDRSDRNLCPELAIYISGKDAGPLAYYVAGFREDYFWCNSQMQIFYRQ